MPSSSETALDVTIEYEEAIFHARNARGHEVTVDMGPKLGRLGGRGFSPRDLLLAALVGCSGSSFVAALHALGQRVTALSARASGTVQPTPPQVFRTIAVHFALSGDDLDETAVREALFACRGDCSIAATLQHVADVTFDVSIAALAPAGAA